MADKHKRSLIKGISYRAIGTATTYGISYVFTGDAKISSAISLVEVISKVAIYYAHERVWERIPFGKSSKLEDFVDNTNH